MLFFKIWLMRLQNLQEFTLPTSSACLWGRCWASCLHSYNLFKHGNLTLEPLLWLSALPFTIFVTCLEVSCFFFRFWRSSWLLHRRCHMVLRQWAVIVLAPWWAFVIVPLKWKRLSWPFFSEKWFSQPLLTLWVNKSAFLGWNENRTLTHALTAHPLTYLLTTAETETWRFSNHSCLGVMGIILCEESPEGRREHLLLWK